MSARKTWILQAAPAVMFVCGVLLWNALHRRDTPPVPVVETRVDTLYVYDTVTAWKPVPFNVYVVDTLYVPVPGDTDTVWVQLPREAKVYRDSTYRAVVSGYRPSLDSIFVFQKTKVVTVTNNVRIPPPRWGWGVQAGVGVNAAGTVTPYVGVGIQYRIGDLRIK